MVARALHMLMIATLVACPVLCKQGVCHLYCSVAVADDVSAVPSCCHECSSLDQQANAPAECPAAPAHPPCDDCRGICGGAIPIDTDDLEGALQLTPAVDALLAPSGFDAALVFYHTQSAHDEANGLHQPSGRALCCLYGSYLL